ncbi:MAG: CapA family protein [Firmicutes bacterium]|nr:CapA family protein [Bacillota bacterium]
MKAAIVFVCSLILFGGIATGLYFVLDHYLGWTPRETVAYVDDAFLREPPENLLPPVYDNSYEEPSYENDMENVYYNTYELYEPEPYEPVCTRVTITLSAAGDTTLGGDRRWAGYHAFMREFENSGRDHSHFLRNVAHIFYESCLSIVNLEGALTYATEHMDKQFVFRGPPHFAKILSSSYVDAVTVSNNHTIDFGQRGYEDTIEALRAEGIVYFGNEFKTIMEVNGIQVGMFGYRIWHDSAENRNRIRAAIYNLQSRGAQLIIAYFHWGTEHVNRPEQYQITIGRYTIRNGADLVLGAHPHVIQGIEEYMGRFIVYSLANFSFGGNSNPRDQDSFIFQQTFSFDNGVLLPYNEKNLIPIFVSSVRGRNDFTPTVAEGADGERILARIEEYSGWLR